MTEPILCIDIGGTSTKLGLVTEDGAVTNTCSIVSRPPVDKFFEDLVAAAKGVGACSRLGVSVAGFLDSGRSTLLYNPNLAWLESFPLRRRLEQQLSQTRVLMEVDSNAAAMAEYRFGSGQQSRRFLCVTVGTGIGVGMCIEGIPLRFAYGCLGDIGHIIVDRNGPECNCGGRGCAEALLSASRIAGLYRDGASLRNVIEDANDGNAHARNILADAGNWLGIAIASMANVLFPDHIAIAGGLSEANEYVLAAVERTFRGSASTLAHSGITMQKASLGAHASLIGAAWPFWMENKERDGKSGS